MDGSRADRGRNILWAEKSIAPRKLPTPHTHARARNRNGLDGNLALRRDVPQRQTTRIRIVTAPTTKVATLKVSGIAFATAAIVSKNPNTPEYLPKEGPRLSTVILLTAQACHRVQSQTERVQAYQTPKTTHTRAHISIRVYILTHTHSHIHSPKRTHTSHTHTHTRARARARANLPTPVTPVMSLSWVTPIRNAAPVVKPDTTDADRKTAKNPRRRKYRTTVTAPVINASTIAALMYSGGGGGGEMEEQRGVSRQPMSHAHTHTHTRTHTHARTHARTGPHLWTAGRSPGQCQCRPWPQGGKRGQRDRPRRGGRCPSKSTQSTASAMRRGHRPVADRPAAIRGRGEGVVFWIEVLNEQNVAVDGV